MAEKTINLSKSKYLAGLQCHKRLWFELNAPDEVPEADQSTQETFRQGHLVGEEAKKLWPNGIEMYSSRGDPLGAMEDSFEEIQHRVPLFEAGFAYKDAYAFVDILEPVGDNEWNIVEVKSSTEPKDVFLEDLALQLYACEGAGLRIRKCILLLINNQYVRKGDINLTKLFQRHDVTAEVQMLAREVQCRLQELLRAANRSKSPEIKIGPHCLEPYACPLQSRCWEFVPEGSVLELYRMRWQKRFELLNGGALGLNELDDDLITNEKHRIQVETCRTNKPHVDREQIQAFLKTLRYPLYFLDFETFSSAIPVLDGLTPYQQVPFQFSLHVVDHAGAEPKHVSYLAAGAYDPRREFLSRLKAALGSTGSIVVYNKSFEVRILRESCAACRGFDSWLENVEERIVDLLQSFQAFHYYHPDQCGSASIKDVLPALTGKNYDQLEIQAGGAASREFMRVTFHFALRAERKRVRDNLEKYCEMDTMAMVWILEELDSIVANK